jgi:hypothetical protein
MKNSAAVELGRRGGKTTSKKKAAAARRNGKKGGRPNNHPSTQYLPVHPIHRGETKDE